MPITSGEEEVWRVKARSEDGFTLVELMAALTVLAIGIVGTIGVMNSSIRVAGTTSSRSKGIAVATKHIETLRAVPYAQLKLAAVDPSAEVVPFNDTVGNRVYSVKRVITNQTEATDPQPSGGSRRTDAYLKGYVSVSWTDESGFHEVHQTTLIYPGGLGAHDLSQTVTTTGNGGLPDPPSSLVAAPVATNTAIDLVWVPPAPRVNIPEPSGYVVQYLPDPPPENGTYQQVATNIPGSTTVLRVTDLASGSAYRFRIYSKAADGRLSTTATQSLVVTTAGSAAVTCAVGTASVTPSAVGKQNGSASSGLGTPSLAVSPQVVVNTVGLCTGTTFKMKYKTRTSGTPAEYPLTGPDASGAFRGTISGTVPWDVGAYDVQIISVAGVASTNRATLGLTVCAHNKQTCP